MPAVSLVEDMEEHVGGIGALREIADFVDDEDRRMRVGRQGLRELAGAKRRRAIVDQGGGCCEEGVEAVLNRAVRDGNRQVGLAAAGLPARMSDRLSVTKSGQSAEPSIWRRNDD